MVYNRSCVIAITACNPFGASRVLLKRTLGNPSIAPIRYVGITHYIGGRSRLKVFASLPHSLQTTTFSSPKCEFLLSFSSSSLQFQLLLTPLPSLREESIRCSSQNRSVNSPALSTGKKDWDVVDEKPAVRMSDGF